MRRRDFLRTSAGFLATTLAPGLWTDDRLRSNETYDPLERCRALKEINPPATPGPQHTLVIAGATLIDGRGASPVSNAVVVIRGNRITATGSQGSIPIPPNAEVVNARGQTVLPGLIDAHFHIGRGSVDVTRLWLTHGITSMRDPGRLIKVYYPIREDDAPMPRCFLTGRFIDSPPTAHPRNAILVENARQTRAAVNRLVDQGASAIKIYYRLPLDLIKVACETAHARCVPVTAHLELVDADRAIRAGLDGIEHITSFGTALANPETAERFRTAVASDNEARQEGRYKLWATLDLDHSPRVEPLLELIAQREVFITPTLGIFERRAGDEQATAMHIRAFENMMRFVDMCHEAGANLVVGSHTSVPKAELGWAYQHEMELMVECGLTSAETLVAGTMNNARFFQAESRLGSLEPSKSADLVLIEGTRLKSIQAMRRIKRVMLNGRWVASNVTEK